MSSPKKTLDKTSQALDLMTSSESLESPTALSLTAAQKRIHSQLQSKSEPAAGAYLGALYVLQQSNNPDRISQSAHSFREMTALLSRLVPTPAVADDGTEADKCPTCQATRTDDSVQKQSLKHKLKSLLDPLGQSHEKYDMYRDWDEIQHTLLGIAHHGKSISIDEYRELVLRLEVFLANFVFDSQTSSRADIDRIIQSGPDVVDWQTLRIRLSRTLEEDRYFFNHATDSWLAPLQQRRFFDTAPECKQIGSRMIHPGWPEAEYLSRMAAAHPAEVMQIINKCNLGSNAMPLNVNVATHFITAALNMPGTVARNMSKKMVSEKWMQRSRNTLLHYKIKDLLDKLIAEGCFPEASSLARTLLVAELKAEHELPNGMKLRKAESILQDYQLSEVLNSFDQVPTAELRPFIRAMIIMLCKIVEIEKTEDPNQPDKPDGRIRDVSSSWRPAIESHEQNWDFDDAHNLLVDKIRDLSERFLSQYTTDATVLDTQLTSLFTCKNQFSFLRRFELHFYRRFPKSFAKQIGEAILSELDDYDCWYETAMLIKEFYPLCDPSVQSELLSKIKAGPGRHEENEVYLAAWKVRRFSLIADHLQGEDKLLYESLLDGKLPAPQPEFHSTHSMELGPISPTSPTDLIDKSTDEIKDVLLNWTPEAAFLGASRDGLARTITETASERPTEFCKLFSEAFDSGFHPSYVCGILEGLKHDALSESDWEQVISGGEAFIKLWTNNQLPAVEPHNSWEAGWDDCFTSLITLVGSALESENLTQEQVLKAVAVLEALCEHHDPSLEDESTKAGITKTAFSLAINSVAGKALNTLLRFNLLRQSPTDAQDKLWSKLRMLLDHVLAGERRLVTCVVLGFYFTALFHADRSLAEKVARATFDTTDLKNRFATLEMYLAGRASRDSHEYLRPTFTKFAHLLPSSCPYQKFNNESPEDLLVLRVISALVQGLEEDGSELVTTTLNNSSSQQRAKAIRRLRPTKITWKPNVDRLCRYWEERLAIGDAKELEAFGSWFAPTFFDHNWLITMTLKTIEVTNGALSSDAYAVLPHLATIANADPLGAIKIADKIARVLGWEYRYVKRTELKSIITTALSSGNEAAVMCANNLTDFLLTVGIDLTSIEINQEPASDDIDEFLD